jgi:hypothetical protein
MQWNDLIHCEFDAALKAFLTFPRDSHYRATRRRSRDVHVKRQFLRQRAEHVLDV